MDLKVPRSEADRIGSKWALVYGRRKTGKTFMLRNFMDIDQYILIGREGTIWIENGDRKKLSSFDDLSDLVKGELEKGKRIVIDEFQRIPMDDLEWISTAHPGGQLILSGSSMSIVDSILGARSPLLGKFMELRLDNIVFQDILSEGLNGYVDLDHAPYVSDPWTIPFMGNGRILKDLYEILISTSYTVPALVGEIFHEEQRNLSEIYQGILTAIGSGTGRSSEIASGLYNKGLIAKESASQVSPYIKALIDMGIIKEVFLFNKRRKVMRFSSQMMHLYYYMESKYGLERGIPPFDVVKENLKRIHSICMEHYLVKELSYYLGGDLRYSFEPELDGIVVDRKERPIAVIEVKWKDLRRSDVMRFDEKTADLDCRRILLTRRSKVNEMDGIEIFDENSIRKMVLGF